MSQISLKKVRPNESAFGATSKATTRSYAQFTEAARKARSEAPTRSNGVIVSLRDAAPGMVLIGCAIVEAIFVEPIRSVRRRFRRATRAA